MIVCCYNINEFNILKKLYKDKGYMFGTEDYHQGDATFSSDAYLVALMVDDLDKSVGWTYIYSESAKSFISGKYIIREEKLNRINENSFIK